MDNNQPREKRQLRNVVTEEEMQTQWKEIQAAQNNPSAFGPIYNRHYLSIFKFLFKRTADETLTAELCSQVFLKAMNQIHKYEFRGVPFASWLFRIASNELGQHYRKTNKMRVVSIEDRSFPGMASEIDLDFGEDGSYEQLKDALLATLDELKENDLKIIEMRFFEKRPFKEIAQIMDITESNAKMKTYRILERMKKKIIKKS